jgi:hypothetical protein
VVLRGCTRSCLPHDCWTDSLRYSSAFASAHCVDCTTIDNYVTPCSVCWTWLLWVWLCAVLVWGMGWFCRKETEGSKMTSAVIESCLLSQLHYKVLQSDTVGAGCPRFKRRPLTLRCASVPELRVWGCRCSVLWRLVVGWVVPDVSMAHNAFVYRG